MGVKTISAIFLSLRHGVYYQNRHHLLEKGWKRDIQANRTKKQAAVAT